MIAGYQTFDILNSMLTYIAAVSVIMRCTINNYITMIGDNLANINPISYISPVNSAFSFAEISLESVLKTLKSINPNKATGPDNIPNKVLKMAAEILSPSLTAIFNRSLSMGIYPDY